MTIPIVWRLWQEFCWKLFKYSLMTLQQPIKLCWILYYPTTTLHSLAGLIYKICRPDINFGFIFNFSVYMHRRVAHALSLPSWVLSGKVLQFEWKNGCPVVPVLMDERDLRKNGKWGLTSEVKMWKKMEKKKM